ncbi:MAG TPA: hypothetical protein VK633_06515 [Verrucomicrobiae bacterium]|nr:hypothetical protein [Verrucomicrobiae bacterium]
MPESNEAFFELNEFVPGLREVFGKRLPDPAKNLQLAVPVKDPGKYPEATPAGTDRRDLAITNGAEYWTWSVTSLGELFRGDKEPPILGDYPAAYNDSFALLDAHVVEISRIFGDRRDKELEEIFSRLRRRPDGKSLGFAHDYMWQACALVLGTRVLSQREFEAIMARVELSCRRFGQGSTSRNYAQSLRSLFDSQP